MFATQHWLKLASIALASTVAAANARGEEIALSFDPNLAFDFDRAQYQQSLERITHQAYAAALGFVGLAREQPLRVAVYTPEHYAQAFGDEAQRQQGAHYVHDAIYVNGGRRLDGRFAGELAHEMTHAALDYRGTGQRLPAWFNEGLAERVSWHQQGMDALGTTQAQMVKSAQEHAALTALPEREPLNAFGYLQAYAAVLCLESKVGHDGVVRIAKKTLEGAAFEAALRGEAHLSLADFERAFGEWAEGLLR